MNDFGYPAALKLALRMFEHSARASGRSTALIDAIEDGDVIIVDKNFMGLHYQDMARRAGKKIKTIVHDPKQEMNRIDVGHLRPGKAHFDHEWLFQHWTWVIQKEQDRIEATVKFNSRSDDERAFRRTQPERRMVDLETTISGRE
ncbi:hypothetical protein [Sphingobium sp. MK2]|uniref:hypothetical protein n=1 Tax=Sphingobium sp. MK2 TaxID=3116540 RepID=UPI0032E367B3